MMGQMGGGQEKLFYVFNLEDYIPQDHLLRSVSPPSMEVTHHDRAFPESFPIPKATNAASRSSSEALDEKSYE